MGGDFSILVVGNTNVCRSPLTERLLADQLAALLAERGGQVSVASAGVRAQPGHAMTSRALAQLERLGGSGDGFRSRVLLPEMVEEADLVLTVTKRLRSKVLVETPLALRRTFTVRELAALVSGVCAGSAEELVADAARRRTAAEVADYDLADPAGASEKVHREVAETISGCVDAIAPPLATALSADAGRRLTNR